MGQFSVLILFDTPIHDMLCNLKAFLWFLMLLKSFNALRAVSEAL